MKAIERHRAFLDLALYRLCARPWKWAALTLVYASAVFLFASVLFFSGALNRQAAILLSEAPAIAVQRMTAGRTVPLPASYQNHIRNIRGVRSVRARLWGYYPHPLTGGLYTLTAVSPQEMEPDEIHAGEGVARTWEGISESAGAAGEPPLLHFTAHDGQSVLLKLTRTFPADLGLISSDLILMAPETFRRITGVPEGLSTDLAVDVGHPAEIPTIARKIARALPDTRTLTRKDLMAAYDALFSFRSGWAFLPFFAALAAFWILAWEKSTGASPEEFHEIGILKATGWTVSDILWIRGWESLVISLTAFLSGVTAAYAHVFFFSGVLFEPVLKGWARLYPRFPLYPDKIAEDLAIILLLLAAPYPIASLIPAWKVASRDPVTALRGGD